MDNDFSENLDIRQAEELEAEATALFKERKIEEAYQAYKEAALIFRKMKDHLQAAHCFSLAAKCEEMRIGLMTVLHAARMNDYAGEEAVAAGFYSDAGWYFRQAGIL